MIARSIAALALWLAIAAQLDRIANEVETRSPAAAHALRLAAEQVRRGHEGR